MLSLGLQIITPLQHAWQFPMHNDPLWTITMWFVCVINGSHSSSVIHWYSAPVMWPKQPGTQHLPDRSLPAILTIGWWLLDTAQINEEWLSSNEEQIQSKCRQPALWAINKLTKSEYLFCRSQIFKFLCYFLYSGSNNLQFFVVVLIPTKGVSAFFYLEPMS